MSKYFHNLAEKIKSNLVGYKLEHKFNFPIHNLSLEKYAIGPQKEKPVYELIMLGYFRFIKAISWIALLGIYTAIARNRYDKEFYKYDDKIVTPIKIDAEIVNKKAYILIY